MSPVAGRVVRRTGSAWALIGTAIDAQASTAIVILPSVLIFPPRRTAPKSELCATKQGSDVVATGRHSISPAFREMRKFHARLSSQGLVGCCGAGV
jgi:hypothetical protein